MEVKTQWSSVENVELLNCGGIKVFQSIIITFQMFPIDICLFYLFYGLLSNIL